MEYNSKLCIFITILLVCDFKFALGGTCKSGYYACKNTWGCCPYGYYCTATKCTGTESNHYYQSTYSSASNVGPIIGYCICGLVGFIFLAAVLMAGYAKCKQAYERPGQVGVIDTQSGGQNRAATAIRY